MDKAQQPDSPSSKSNYSNCNTTHNVSTFESIKPSYGRYCHIVKRPDFDGYGFNLHSEKIKAGQYIGKVDPDSPAEAAGLREGDQIIEVNGVNIGVETHKQVVQRIKAISNEVRLLLIDPTIESVAINTNSQTTTTAVTIGAVNTNTNKSNNNNSSYNNNSTTTTPTTPNFTRTTTTTMAMIEEATVAPKHQKATDISMVNDSTVNDFNSSEETVNNGQNATTTTITNGKSFEIAISIIPSEVAPTTTTATPSPSPPPPPSEQQMTDSLNNKSLMSQNTDAQPGNKPILNLNLTAAEMRAKLLAKKKFDPKNESVDLKKKFDIIQKL